MKNNLPSFGSAFLGLSMFFVGALSVQGQDLLFDNGSVFNIAGPPQVSMLQDASLGMSTYGFGAANASGYRVADDFVLANDADISTIDFYSYQTGATTATVNAVYVQVYNGNPSSGGTLVWGDLTTNRFATAVLSGGYRQLESAPGDTTRQIQKVTANTTGLSLTAGTYWVEYTLAGTGSSGPWAPPVTVTGQSTTGDAIQWNGTAYAALVDVGNQGMPFQVYGEEAGGGTFPEPYCVVSGLSSVEPITHVLFADIDNVSSPDTSSPSHEDFTSVVGNVSLGQSYDFTAEGYTGGNFTTSVRVYIDWNQDNDFTDAGEYYYIGTIANSTGTDGITVTAPIAVPSDALEGNTRMRVIKKFLASDPSPNDGCTGGSSFGQAEDYTLAVAAGGGSGEDCDQGDDSNGFENGFNITAGGTYRNADDFVVSAGNTLNIQQIELNVFASEDFTEMNFNIFPDEAGLPGAIAVETLTNVPVTTVAIGSNFGYTIFATFADVNISLPEGTYWLQPEAIVTTAFWEVSSVGTLGSPVVNSDGGGAWIPDAEGNQGVFKLHCEPVTPPEEQCLLSFGTVEPITRVLFANVDNPSDVNSTVQIEDFTSITANLEVGQSYDMALEGTTAGNYTDYFTAWIDWNQNGVYTDPGEMYEIGSITNSTGADGQQAVWPITIPGDALVGTTTMRIVKNWNVSPTDPCGVYSFGQAEDYSVNLTSGGGGTDCGHETLSNGFEDGYGNMSALIFANDFKVTANTSFAPTEFKFNVFMNPGVTMSSVDVYFYEDTAGSGPGTQLNVLTGLVPVSDVVVGNNFGFDIHEVVFDLSAAGVTINNSADTDANFWVGAMAYPSDGSTTYMEVTSSLNTDNQIYFDNAGVWTPGSAIGGAATDGVMSISGSCSELGVGDMDSFNFAYYPNPVKDVLNITSQKAVKSVEAYNLAGQKVMSGAKVINGQINVNALTPGTYVFKVTLEGGQIETFKIIKK